MLVRVFAAAVVLALPLAFTPAALAQDNFWQSAPQDKPARPERKKAAPAPAKKAPAAPAAAPAEGGQAPGMGAQAAPAPADATPPAAAAPPAAEATAPPAATPPAAPAAPAAATAAAVAEQETVFWNSIKDSTNAEEFKAYLRKYPKGTFAELAQIKIKQLQPAQGSAQAQLPRAQTPGGQTPGAQTPGGQAPGQGKAAVAPPAATSFNAAMKEAQERLYGLNYDIVRFDGIPDEKTERAIRAWQQRAGYPATGAITLPQLARLRQIPQVKVWGAVAFAGLNGAAVVVTGQLTRAKAEGKALADCLAKAGRACNAFAVPETRCGALAYFRQRLVNGTYTVTHAVGQDVTVPGATARALANCNKSEGTAGRCGILASVCASGQGNVYAPAFSDVPAPLPGGPGQAQGGPPPSVAPMPAPQAPPARPVRRPGEQDT